MATETPGRPAEASGTFTIGGDLPVHRMGFGAMQLTGEGVWGPPRDRDEAIRVLRRAVELGVTLLDTADSYGPEVAEELIAEALHPYPDDLVVATKGGLTRQGPDRWTPVGRAPYLRQCVEMSLRRLRLERIDLYQLHRVDPRTPMEESLGELRDLQQEGKIRHIGLSEVGVEEIQQAREIVDVVSVQNMYSLAERRHEDIVALCEREGIGFIPWFPLGGKGQLARGEGAVGEVAAAHGATPAQVALAWLLHRSQVMLPIPGTSTLNHLDENIEAARLELSDEELRRLEDEQGG